VRPISAELEFHWYASNYSHYETDSKNLSPEASRFVIHGIVASQGDCLEHDNEQRKTHGELWKEIVKRGSESKMKAVNKKCVAHNSVLGVSSQAQH
jgi:hypothetical protein